MKAKDIAAKIIAACTGESRDADMMIIANECIDIINEANELVKQRKNIESKLGAWREALTKWKSVVRQVQEVKPDSDITVNLFGFIISEQSADTFKYLKDNKIFIGYEMTETEKRVIMNVETKQMLGNFFNNALRELR